MPRPGEAPAPVFTGLPYGENALVNQMSEAIPDDEPFVEPGFDELAGFEPGDDKTAFLFSETDRPDEPLTQGMGFGPGADFSRHAHESNADLLNRVADSIASDVSAPKEARAFADRVKRGY